jgi:hypothetical protein
MNRKEIKPKWIFEVKLKGKPYRYMVRFFINRERIYLGCFETVKEAEKAIKEWQKARKKCES